MVSATPPYVSWERGATLADDILSRWRPCNLPIPLSLQRRPNLRLCISPRLILELISPLRPIKLPLLRSNQRFSRNPKPSRRRKTRNPTAGSTAGTVQRTPLQGQFVRTVHGDFVPRARDTSGASITTLAQAPPPAPPSVRPNKHKANGIIPTHTLGPSGGKLLPEVEVDGNILSRPKNIATYAPDFATEFEKYEKIIGHTAQGDAIARPKSVISTRSRRSKYGDDDAEPWWDIHKRRWLDVSAYYWHLRPVADEIAVPLERWCQDSRGQGSWCR